MHEWEGGCSPGPATAPLASPAGFFQDLNEAFQRAAQTASERPDHYFEIAGLPVRLCFAGPALAQPLTRALAHRSSSAGPAALTISVWDSASTGIPLPPPAWDWSARGRRGLIDGFNDHRFRTLYQDGIEAFAMLDGELGQAIYWMRDAALCPYFEIGAPLRFIFHWWMAQRSRYMIHAAAVGAQTGGVLLAGKGGSGKSTSALACLHSELLHAGEDYVLLAERPAPHVFSLYQSAKLHADQMWRVPHLAPLITNPGRLDHEKALLFLSEGYADKLADGFPVRAILLPRVTGQRDTRLVQTSPARSLTALIPSSVMQLLGVDRGALPAIARLVQRVPSYDLEVGTDLAQIPAVILSLLKQEALSVS